MALEMKRKIYPFIKEGKRGKILVVGPSSPQEFQEFGNGLSLSELGEERDHSGNGFGLSSLSKLWRLLGFDVVEKLDLKNRNFLKSVGSFLSSDFSKSDSVLFYFSGQASRVKEEDGILSFDKKFVSISKIIQPALSNKTLKGKPKIFLFDCWGSANQFGEGGKLLLFGEKEKESQFSCEDCLIGYSIDPQSPENDLGFGKELFNLFVDPNKKSLLPESPEVILDALRMVDFKFKEKTMSRTVCFEDYLTGDYYLHFKGRLDQCSLCSKNTQSLSSCPLEICQFLVCLECLYTCKLCSSSSCLTHFEEKDERECTICHQELCGLCPEIEDAHDCPLCSGCEFADFVECIYCSDMVHSKECFDECMCKEERCYKCNEFYVGDMDDCGSCDSTYCPDHGDLCDTCGAGVCETCAAGGKSCCSEDEGEEKKEGKEEEDSDEEEDEEEDEEDLTKKMESLKLESVAPKKTANKNKQKKEPSKPNTSKETTENEPSDEALRVFFRSNWEKSQRSFALEKDVKETTLSRFLKGNASPTARKALLRFYFEKQGDDGETKKTI